ncbi:hypothetical protein HDU82_002721, partial [Entophlyctis luteolus]
FHIFGLGMANLVFFVKHANYQPIKIETHYIGEQERRRPLSDVADMIGAVKQALAPQFDSTPVHKLTLHAVVDGVKGPALEPDYLLPNLTTGVTAKTALVIKSRRDMEVLVHPFDPTSYRPEFPFFISPDSNEHLTLLGRDEVVRRINQAIDNRSGWPKYMPFIISTSRGMGKTFLLKAIGSQRLKQELKSPFFVEAATLAEFYHLILGRSHTL